MNLRQEQISEEIDSIISDADSLVEDSELIPCQGITSMGTMCGRMSSTGWCYQHGPTL